MKCQLLKKCGEILDIKPSNGKNFTLAECYYHIECQTIEVIRCTNDMILICDEESKLVDDWEADINLKATEYYKEGRMTQEQMKAYAKEQGFTFIDGTIGLGDHWDCIAGNAIYCHTSLLD